jgi:hypothetical protein
MDAPIRSDKWRNMWFSKDGAWFLAKPIYSTEAAAKDAVNERLRHHDPDILYWTDICDSGNRFLKNRFSHTIQLPVKS